MIIMQQKETTYQRTTGYLRRGPHKHKHFDFDRMYIVAWFGRCGAKRKGLATATWRVGSMYCAAGDPEPALHSQLGKNLR